MKSDTERKKFHYEKLHRKKNRLHVHLSKELRGKVKQKRRSLLVRKGDTVRIMRGPEKGKEAKVGGVDVNRRVVFLEGIAAKNARGREVPMPLQPSNLLLLSLEPSKERKELFSEEAFRKKEASKPKPETEGRKQETDGHKEEHKAHEAKSEHKAEHGTEHRGAHAHEHHAEKEHRPEHKAKHEHAK